MEVFRVDISSWTASFRYPNLISGIQLTLEVPPLSTVLGLINAAAGRYLRHQNLRIGYFFQYGAMEFDLETIYQIPSTKEGRPKNKEIKSNVVKRQFLFENRLSIYLESEELVNYLRQPHYDILLGRSNDLATVETIQKITLREVPNAEKLKGQIVPFYGNRLPGKIQALPRYFSNTIPRLNLGTEAFSILDFKAQDLKTHLTAYRDDSLLKDGVDIYFHELDCSNYE
ncbi:MAG: type I-B CRISPR-associated protein Cas5b [Bacteroidota bacterium]